MPANEQVELTIAALPQSVGQARAAVRKLMTDCGFEATSDDVLLCLSEALTNSITHAKDVDMVTVIARCCGRMVRVEVHDPDSTRPIVEAPARGETRGQLPQAGLVEESGRGLLLIDAVASRWGVTPKAPGKMVWFEKDVVFEQPDKGAILASAGLC